MISLLNEVLKCIPFFFVDAEVALEGKDLADFFEGKSGLNLAFLVGLPAVDHGLVLSVVHEELSHGNLFLDVVLAHPLHVLVQIHLVRLGLIGYVLLIQHLLHLIRILHRRICPVDVVHHDVIVHDALNMDRVNRNIQLVIQVQKLGITYLILLHVLHLVQVVFELVRCRCHETLAITFLLTAILWSRPVYSLTFVIVVQEIIILFLLLLVNRFVELFNLRLDLGLLYDFGVSWTGSASLFAKFSVEHVDMVFNIALVDAVV